MKGLPRVRGGPSCIHNHTLGKQKRWSNSVQGARTRPSTRMSSAAPTYEDGGGNGGRPPKVEAATDVLRSSCFLLLREGNSPSWPCGASTTASDGCVTGYPKACGTGDSPARLANCHGENVSSPIGRSCATAFTVRDAVWHGIRTHSLREDPRPTGGDPRIRAPPSPSARDQGTGAAYSHGSVGAEWKLDQLDSRRLET